MKRGRVALIAALGFFALVSQTMLFRDFLSALEASEPAIGAFFASWLLWVAAGAWAGKRFVGARPDPKFSIEALSLLYIPALVIQHELFAHARPLIVMPAFAAVSYSAMIFIAAVFGAPVSFLTGFLFTFACSKTAHEAPWTVSRVYIVETMGGFVGGLAVTSILALGIAPECTILYSSVILVLCVWIARTERTNTRKWVRIAIAISIAGLIVPCHSLGAGWARLENRSEWARLLPAESYRGSFTTSQAKYLFGEREKQFLLLTAGGVTEEIPETEHSGELAAIGLAEKPDAKNILFVGSSGLTVADAFYRLSQTEKVVWLHPDPELPKALLTALPQKWREAARVVIPGVEVREYLRTTREQFDLVYLNIPEASNLVLNRYSTREFFQEVERILAPDGICAVRMAGGANYLGGELALLGASTRATLASVFGSLAMKPGEESWFLAARNGGLSESPETLQRQFTSIPGAASLYPPEALGALFQRDRIDFQQSKYDQAAAEYGDQVLLNSDSAPKALFFHLLLAIRRNAGASLAAFAPTLSRTGVWILLGGVLVFLFLRATYLWKTRKVSSAREPRFFDLDFLVSVVGGVGMAVSVLLMFAYQSFYGALFLHVGLIASLFMLGSAIGGTVSENYQARAESKVLAAIGVLSGFQILFFAALFVFAADASKWVLAILVLAGGAFSGLYIPLAANMMKTGGQSAAEAAARLESFDFIGGALGAGVTGLALLPLLGSGSTVIILAALIVVAGALVLASAFAGAYLDLAESAFDRKSRKMGYALFGLGVFFLISLAVVDYARINSEAKDLRNYAAEMAGGGEVRARTANMPDQGVLDYYEVFSAPGAIAGYVFPSSKIVHGISGYGGPIGLGVFIDADGAIKDYRILRSNETPAYLIFLRTWMESLKDRKPAEKTAFVGVDAVSGATMTSKALLRILDSSGKTFLSAVMGKQIEGTQEGRKPQPWPLHFLALIIFAAAAVILRFRPGVWTRRIFLASVLFIFGFLWNLQFSTYHVLSFASLRWPGFGLTAPLFLVIFVPLLVAVFGNVYCGYLCPFGAFQELVGDLRPKGIKTDPGKDAWRYGRAVKYMLLFLMAALFSVTGDLSVLRADPLTTFFGAMKDVPILIFGVGVLVLSFFYRRFWCRNLCPAGAFLALLNGIRLLGKKIPVTRPHACDLGVRGTADLDCIQCDRCRNEKR